MTVKKENVAQPNIDSSVDKPQGALALVSAWREVPDEVIDSMIEHVYKHRQNDATRTVKLEL